MGSKTYRNKLDIDLADSKRRQQRKKLEASTTGDDCVEGLTLYEMNRLPRTIREDAELWTVAERGLKDKMTCAVCLGIIRNTMTVMECLHRFCNECITQSLRTGKKECPSCRVKVPTHRNLREDLQFDGIISTFYPDLDAHDKEEDELMHQIARQAAGRNALAASVEAGIARQRKNKLTRATTSDTYSPATTTSSLRRSTSNISAAAKRAQKATAANTNKRKASSTSGEARTTSSAAYKKRYMSVHANAMPQFVAFRLQSSQLAPNAGAEERADTALLESLNFKAPHTAPMVAVRKLVAKHFGKPNWQQFRLTVQPSNMEPIPLPDELSLGDVQANLWNSPTDVILVFANER